MVTGGDSCSEGHGFKSRHCILDGHFFTNICCKICNVCLIRPKINEKEARVGPFFKRKRQTLFGAELKKHIFAAKETSPR